MIIIAPSSISVSIPSVPNVPSFSQFLNIESPKWQKVGCGITSLAMVIDYYKPNAVTVDALLARGIALGAYDSSAGWIHGDLVSLSKKYGLDGSTHDLSKSSASSALAALQKSVNNGPVIASVHYKMDPKNPIPHLVVIDAINNGIVYYNDPASTSGKKQITTANFMKAWKQRYIVIKEA